MGCRVHSLEANLKICYMGSDSGDIIRIAHWQHDEFGYLNPSTTLNNRIDRLKACRDGGGLPLSLVAKFDCDIVGSASILEKSIISLDLSPWLSSVYVPPQHRGKGIASALSSRAIHETAKLGFGRLYLFTPKSEHLYARLGWVAFDKLNHRGTPLTLMWRSTALLSQS